MVLDGNLKRGRPILAKADKVGREPAPPSLRVQLRLTPAVVPPSGVISFHQQLQKPLMSCEENGDRVARIYPSCKGIKLNP